MGQLQFIAGSLPVLMREGVIRFLVGANCLTTSTFKWPPMMVENPGQVVDATTVLDGLISRPMVVARGANELAVIPVDDKIDGDAEGLLGSAAVHDSLATHSQYAEYRSQPVAAYIRS